MAYGGIPSYIFSGPQGAFTNFVRIDGLTLEANAAFPPDIANPDTGQLTTGVPGPNQTALPPEFGRGRGNWRPEDANLIIDALRVMIDPLGILGFAVPATVIPSPTVINGDLVLTHYNLPTAPFVGPLPVRVLVQYLPPISVYSRGRPSDLW